MPTIGKVEDAKSVKIRGALHQEVRRRVVDEGGTIYGWVEAAIEAALKKGSRRAQR